MKAFELTVYPRLERPRYGYGIGPYRERWKRERKLIESKRFTDSELAAEYWRAGDDMTEANYDRDVGAESISRILHRFATLPHYDEEPQP